MSYNATATNVTKNTLQVTDLEAAEKLDLPECNPICMMPTSLENLKVKMQWLKEEAEAGRIFEQRSAAVPSMSLDMVWPDRDIGKPSIIERWVDREVRPRCS